MGRLAKARSGRGLRSRSGKQSAECGRDARRGSEVDLVDMVNVVVGGDAAEASTARGILRLRLTLIRLFGAEMRGYRGGRGRDYSNS
jgi:hypothetical protein